MKKITIVALLALSALVRPALRAQTPLPPGALRIHGHPQKAFYASDAEWPTIEAQGWWDQADPIQACHLHLGVVFPSYAELTTAAPFDTHFTLKLHNCSGSITQIFGGGFNNVIWDDTGTSTPPVMRGINPGLVQWSGRTTILFRLHGDQPWLGTLNDLPVHGWIADDWNARALLDNGDEISVQKVDCLYSLLDPTKPEQPASGQGNPGIVHSSRVTVRNLKVDPTRPGRTLGDTSFGAMVMEVNDYVPLLPIGGDASSTPWKTIVNPYNYTAASALPDGRFMVLEDANLHGMPPPPNRGTTLVSDPAGVTGFINRTIIFDPAVMGTGAHKVLTVWRQTAGNENIHAVLSISVPVAAGGVGVMLCTNSAALNVGRPLPCVFPPPPPPTCTLPQILVNGICVTPDVLSPAVGVFQLLTSGVPTGRFFTCPTSVLTVAACKELVAKP